MMDIRATEGPSMTSGVSTLTATASSLNRLDDKLATGMTITDVANARWLTSVEVLTFLEQAAACNYQEYPLMTGPPTTPPTTGTLLLYNSEETPDYSKDGIEWIKDPAVKWKSIERVLAKYGESQSDSDSQSGGGSHVSSSVTGGSPPVGGGMGQGLGTQVKGSSSESSSALLSGASSEYLSCATRNTFHRREYRGPNNFILLHYLDSVRALRMTSELVDRIVLLSADADASLPTVSGGPLPGKDSYSSGETGTKSKSDSSNDNQNLGNTMNILMEMVDEHDAVGTSAAEAVDEHVMKAASDAAYNAVMKHIAPEEAMGVVDAIEMAMEDNMLGEEELAEIEDVTALEIDEAIDQVLCGGGPIDGMDGEGMKEGGSSKRSVSSSSDGDTKTKGAAEIIEDRILDSMEEVLPEALRLKLINTTEVMLDAAGVSLKSSKGRKNEGKQRASMPLPPGVPHAIDSPGAATGTGLWDGHALPEIIDVTPDFHVMGYQPTAPPTGKYRKKSKPHTHSVVISTKSPIPGLPPYVDQYYVWERFAAFVDFQEVADDPQVRNVSFNRITPLTPFSYKIKMPSDIPNYSARHIVVVGVLLPKDHRVKRNLRGIELALKLTLQTEWSAAADLVGAYAYAQSQKGQDATPIIKGVKRPIFIAPCGGTRMQMLTQISKVKFTMYPASSLPTDLSNAMSSSAAPNFVQRVAKAATAQSSSGTEAGIESKRKRNNYFEEWAATPGIDANMTSAEVDRHRKVRFVERISSAITSGNGEDAMFPNFSSAGKDMKMDGVNVEDMDEGAIDDLLGRVLMRYVEVCIDRCTTKEELFGEINWSEYAGLSLMHHASFYNFMPLITLLINSGADLNIMSSEGDLTPIHFAAAAGHKEVVDVLIRNGCNPTIMDSNGDTPADHARKAGHVEIAAMLAAYNEQAGIRARDDPEGMDGDIPLSTTSDVFLQSAFKELSLKDKLGLNLFVDRSKAAPMAFVRKSSQSMMTDVDGEDLENTAFSFISEGDRTKLRDMMSLANDCDLQEMNQRAQDQDVRRYLRQSNYEAISAASQALEKANRKESDILKNASSTSDDPSKMQLSRALAMLVLRKNLPGA